MAKRNKRKQNDKPGFFDDLAPHTKQAIGAVAFVVLGVFFILSSLQYAGVAGEVTHSTLTALLGVGFVLAPIICGLYVYVLLKPRDDEHVSMSKVLGVALFFVATLGMLSLFYEAGGLVGTTIKMPLAWLFGDVVTGVLLGALILTGLFMTFNTSFFSIFKKKKEPEDDGEAIDAAKLPPGYNDLTETLAADEVEESGDETLEKSNEDSAQKESMRERLMKKVSTSGFAVTSFQGPYAPPSLSLLNKDKGKANIGDLKAKANVIKRTLQKFNIQVEMDEVTLGPSVTRYAIKPAEGVKLEKIVNLQTNLEYALAASPIRIEAPIPGKSLVGIEVPNSQKSTIGLASLLKSPEFTDSPKPLLVGLGKDITGNGHFVDVAKMPHGLIAGTTGSGKSVTINAIITSLLFRNSPDQLRFIMVDPKRVELTLYNEIPHLLTPVITEPKKAILALKWAIKEMERRYDVLQQEKVRDITAYHEEVYQPAKQKLDTQKKPAEEDVVELPEAMPYIVIIIDELSDLMQSYPRELEASIVRLAQMSRAVGIHLILATQRPEVKVITGLIKANVPCRIALKVNSQIDSRTILDSIGAEKLLGYGDMLYLTTDKPKPTRLQSAYVTTQETKRVVEYLKNQSDVQELPSIDLSGNGGAEAGPDAIFSQSLDGDEEEDDLYEEAKAAVTEAGKASTSYLQRKLRIGYSRAARLIDLLEERGVIGPQDGSKPRTILTGNEDEESTHTYD